MKNFAGMEKAFLPHAYEPLHPLYMMCVQRQL